MEEAPSTTLDPTPSSDSTQDVNVELEESTAAEPVNIPEENSTSDVAEETPNNDSENTVEAINASESESEAAANVESEIVEEESLETGAEIAEETQDVPDAAEQNETVEELEDTADSSEEAEQTPLEETEEVVVDETQEVAEEQVVVDETQEVAEEQVVVDETQEVAEEEVVDETQEVAEEEVVDETQEEVAEESSEEENAEESASEPDLGQLDRVAYETQFQEAPNDLAILMQEEFQSTQLMDYSGLQLYGSVPSVKDISSRLAELAEQTGKKPAFINISLQSNQLEAFVVLPDRTIAAAKNSTVASSNLNGINNSEPKNTVVRKTVENTSRKDLLATATEFREEISDIGKLDRTDYLSSAQKLYQVLIEPIEAELEANDIDILVFSMDSGLRLLPVAALHDGEQFLVEKYAMGIVPSFGLTDTRYVNLQRSSILAMGASEFEDQPALPTMPIELETILRSPRQGVSFLNEQFTIANFVAQNSREIPFSIVHLGTHAEFKAGDLDDSFIQFYNEKLNIPQLRKLSNDLGWNTDAAPVELLVLSACETALGDREAELGFAGLAVQAGVKSALASLWYVSDLGTLALMGEFYDRLGDNLVKAEALRQTQLQMLQEEVKIDNRQVKLSNGEELMLPEGYPDGTLSLAHPYFWSAFTLIGNWN